MKNQVTPVPGKWYTKEANEITEDLLAALLDKQVVARVKHYSYHDHLTELSGSVIQVPTGRAGVDMKYLFEANEAYGIEDIYEIKLGWD